MSRSLAIKSDPTSQPAATDPLERQSWCALRIQVGARSASRLWDKELRDERDLLYVPAFPIAEWIVQNWWAIFNELCPGNAIPKGPALKGHWLRWTKRHCLRAADSALLLPKLYFYFDGSSLVTESRADPPGSLPHMPGEFLNDIVEMIEPRDATTSLAMFVDQTLGRVEGVLDERLSQVVRQWTAIQNADREEIQFCKLAGRMGLDPYSSEDISETLGEFFEALGDADLPVMRDLTESARPEHVEAQWAWVNDTSRELHLGPRTVDLPFNLPATKRSPADYGYELARRARSAADVAVGSRIDSVPKFAEAATRKPFKVVYRNHIPGQEIRAIVGQAGNDGFLAAGPEMRNPLSQRFSHARSLYHALATSSDSPRLVTGAYSLDQKASRAFAAELLAPQKALLNLVNESTADPDTVERLGDHFSVSVKVIENQLENAGIELSTD